MKFYIVILGIVAVSIPIGALLFMSVHEENLQICANLHDEISSLLSGKDMLRIEELVNEYNFYNCDAKIDQWDDLAKYNVVRPT